MSVMEDLISFDIIENQKENIQSLPQGRSAKALAQQFGPTPFSPTPTPGATRSLNDAIRQEYETELHGIADADDPLDIYDRYVKWTMNAYPSAQATPDSQLRPLLERATKTFQGSAQYKNDVRYLKLWLSYIRFFSDAPRETYAYLSRHGIGDGLALFYEEFAAWLESAGRYTQAEEVYKLGIDKEARPSERLMRKFTEFQKRFEARPQDADEPTSPALPTVRPALAAKLDPFASSTAADPQSRRGIGPSATNKSGRTKMAIFSDANSDSASRPGSGDGSRGWDNIGTIAERRKENVMEARPWAGETLKAGKKTASMKMMVFKDQPTNESRSVIITTKNGKTEKWFADILSVCPNENNSKDEYCFEELRARHRGWLERDWRAASSASRSPESTRPRESTQSLTDQTMDLVLESTQTLNLLDGVVSADSGDAVKKTKLKKKKVMEVRGETQTIKAVLDSPVKKTKLKRKKSSEATMTLHTKAATDDVMDLFNQPLTNIGPIGSRESDGDTTDYDPDDYTCGVSSVGDNTRTYNLSETESVYDDDETGHQSITEPDENTRPESVSPWSDFSTRRHVPEVDTQQIETFGGADALGNSTSQHRRSAEDEEQLQTPIEPEHADDVFTKYVQAPPDGFDMPRKPFRSAEEAAQSRLPFMTPIVEITESSIGLPTVRREREAQYPKTPSRRKGDVTETIPEIDSPLQDLSLESCSVRDKDAEATHFPKGPTVGFRDPIFHDKQLNPHDLPVRNAIMDAAGLANFPGYLDDRDLEFKRGTELRRFVKSLKMSTRASSDRLHPVNPSIQFPGQEEVAYTIQKELGKGAYAPVYLATVASSDQLEHIESFVAVKSEDPPSAWEFYILSVLHERLARLSPWAAPTITRPLSFHHFADEVYLIEPYHDQGTLLDLVNLVRAEPALLGTTNASSSTLGLDECVAMFFAVELLRSMDAMHGAGIIHGDLKADNCLVRLDSIELSSWSSRYEATGSNGWSNKGMTLIDFGRSIDLTAFRRDVGFLADWKTTKDDCVEMRELRPWTHQVDYWGAAGILHVMLFGKWIEDIIGRNSSSTTADEEDTLEKTMVVGKAGVQRRKLKESLKRYWQTELWTDVFDLLMNPTVWTDGENGGSLPATNRLGDVTKALERWLEENSEKRGLRSQLKKLEDRLRERRRKE